jgi:uncharacterized membrane protein YczE
MGPKIRGARRRPIFGALLVVLSVAVFVGVTGHVCGEAGQPADDHLPVLLVALLAACITLGLGIALMLPRPPQGSWRSK